MWNYEIFRPKMGTSALDILDIGEELSEDADVTGALSFGGSASLSYSIWPTNTVQLFTYGSLTGPSAWTLNAGRQARHYDIEMGTSEVLLRYKPIGTGIFLR